MSVSHARTAVGILFVLALAAWPLVFSSPFDLRIFTLAGVFAVMVIGYQFIFGHVGALALSQATFFGLGAYATAICAVHLGFGFPATLTLSVLVAVSVALFIAIPVLRLGSHYFALATLGISQIVTLVALEWVSLTGGGNGLSGVPLPSIAGLVIPRGWPLMLLVWSFVAAGGFVAWQMMRGLYGKACHVVRDDEVAARSLGIDIHRIRLTMLLLSAAYGGVAGALFAHVNRIASPEALEFKTMVLCLTMAVVGGRTKVAGAIVGALLIVHLPEWFRFLDRSYVMVNAIILIGLLIVAPEGLVGLLDRVLPRAPGEGMGKTLARHRPAMSPPARGALLPSTTPILEVRNLVKRFGGVKAIDDVSFDLHRGTITAVIGPNGSGKTTLVNCITGVEVPDVGAITLGGSAITGGRPHDIARAGIARTFQNLRLVDDMSVLDNVAVARFEAEGAGPLNALKIGREDPRLLRAYAYALHLLHRLGVEEVHRLCGSLPYGVKRRVEIARALALDPQVLLLDEPAAGLNESEQNDLAARLQDLAANGVTLLIIEHNMPFLRTLATYMICLDQGRVIAEGRPREIYENPLVLDAYLGRGAGASSASSPVFAEAGV
ncbi:branched-chain amino acid ABC transporter ATP-binding protein/permease [Xanthobacter sp. KR7-65]|uniref:branched-chain amino acid ABC transporter ATP-binding protein/permease n=1 Tax=Xanthobacter sp. KR7-65 TaxID=3156612 RepID=UPI0032B54B3E